MFWRKKPVQDAPVRDKWVMDHDAMEAIDDASDRFNDYLTEQAYQKSLKSELVDRHGNPIITKQHVLDALKEMDYA